MREKKRKQRKGMRRMTTLLLSVFFLFGFFFLSCGSPVSAQEEKGAFYDLSLRQNLLQRENSSKPVVRYRLEALDGAPLPGTDSDVYDFSVEGEGTHTVGRLFFSRPGVYRYNLYALSVSSSSGVWKRDERHYRLEVHVYHADNGNTGWTVVMIIKNEEGKKEAEMVFSHEQKAESSKPPVHPPKPPVNPSRPSVKPTESPRTGVSIQPFVTLLTVSGGLFLLSVRGKGEIKDRHRGSDVA